MAGWLEQLAGALLILCALLDIFLTVLYARIGSHGLSRAGTGIISLRVARATWWMFRHIPSRLPVQRDAVRSFCGAVTVVFLGPVRRRQQPVVHLQQRLFPADGLLSPAVPRQRADRHGQSPPR
jgi:hypothetical protein